MSALNRGSSPPKQPKQPLILYFVVGVVFGIVATKSQIISWYRIQEMFRFHSVHMYGIIGSAVAVAAVSILLIRWLEARSLGGEEIHIPPKDPGSGLRTVIGGSVFGLGWGLVGSCPGPIFALLGNGVTIILVVLLSALAGTWTYAAVRHRLPH